MTTLTLIISGQTLVISGEGLTVEVKTNSSGMVSETIDPSIDRVSPPASQAHHGGDDANAGGSHEVGPTRLKTETNISLAARESQQAAAPIPSQEAEVVTPQFQAKPEPAESMGDKISATNSNSSRRSSPVTDKAGEAFLPQATSPATNSLSAVPAAETTREKTPQQLVSPVALIKPRAPLRPNCLSPSECAGYGTKTCHRCTVAAERPAA